MNSIQRRYTRSSFPALVYCGMNKPMNGLIRDEALWEKFDEQTIASYMSEGSEMLVDSLKSFVQPESAYNSFKAKEMRFMLEALIEVKEIFMPEDLPVIRREA